MGRSVSSAAHQIDIDGSILPPPLQDGNYTSWRFLPDGDRKPRKIPCHPDGTPHSTDNPAPLLTWDQAREVAARTGYGVGYRIPAGSGIVCLDLDSCTLPDGTETAAAALARRVFSGAFVEVSVSGTGLHFWFKAPDMNDTGGKAHPLLGDFDLFTGPARFVALGTSPDSWGDLPEGHGPALRALLGVQGGAQHQPSSPADWGGKSERERAECVADLRSALAALDPDSHDEWVKAGQNLACLGDRGRELWEAWAATSRRFPGGEGLERWDTFSGDRSDYRSIFARASRAGWVQPRRTADPTEVFGVVPVELPEGATTEAPALASFAHTGDIRDGFGNCPPLTFPGNAQRVALMFRDRLRWAHDAQKWLIWNDGHWSITEEAVLLSDLAQRLPASIYAEGSRVSHPDAMRHFPDWARKTGDPVALRKTLDIVRGRLEHRASLTEFDADAYLLGFDSGRQVADLRSGRTRPAQQGDRVTRSCAVPALGDPARAARWVRFLDEVTCNDPELRSWLRAWLGYCLTGSTSEQAFGFFFGGGANGKSVLAEVMLTLLGTYAATIRSAALCSSDHLNAAAPTPDLARLDGVRLLLSPEAEEGTRFAESQLKALTAGDTFPVRELYGQPRDFVPRMKLVITGNHRPAVSGQDAGIWRRVRLVPFRASFEGAARDPHLKARLLEEGPHILAWLVEAAGEFLRSGLPPCRVIEDATDDYRDDHDPLGDFLNDRCLQGGETASSDVFRVYQAWALAAGIRNPWTQRGLSCRLNDYRRNGWCIASRRTASARLLAGVSLRSPF